MHAVLQHPRLGFLGKAALTACHALPTPKEGGRQSPAAAMRPSFGLECAMMACVIELAAQNPHEKGLDMA
jgi:hypothetical protein